MSSTITAGRSAADTAEQLRELEADLLAGRPVREAVAAHRSRHGLTTKRARRDYQRLRANWSRDHSPDVERGRSLARAELLYRRAMEAGDVGVALEAERLRVELLGLLDPTAKNATKKSEGATC